MLKNGQCQTINLKELGKPVGSMKCVVCGKKTNMLSRYLACCRDCRGTKEFKVIKKESLKVVVRPFNDKAIYRSVK